MSTLVNPQDSIITVCSNTHVPAEPITETWYSPDDYSVKTFVSANVLPPSMLYWNGLTPDKVKIDIEPSFVSSEEVLIRLISAVISHPFSSRQNDSRV